MRSSESSSHPLVSVVVPMYNAERYIDRTIKSVLGQDYLNVEVVCVDDFSTDSTAELVIGTTKVDSRVRFFRNGQKGANSARKLGVLSATGDLIMFLDSDDELVDGAVGHLVGLYLATDSDLVCANIIYSEEGREGTRFSYPSAGLSVNLEQCPDAALEIKPSACAKLFSAGILKGMEFIDVPFAQDWNISYKAIANVRQVAFSNEAVYRYWIREGSTSTRKSALKLVDLMAVTSCLSDILEYAGLGGRKLPAREATVIASRFILNMIGRSFHLEINDRRAAYMYLKKTFSELTDRRVVISVIGVDRGRVALLLCALSCWPAYEVVRKGWSRGRRMP